MTTIQMETALRKFIPPPGQNEMAVTEADFHRALPPGVTRRQWPELRATANKLGIFVGHHHGAYHIFRKVKPAPDAVTTPAPALPAPPARGPHTTRNGYPFNAVQAAAYDYLKANPPLSGPPLYPKPFGLPPGTTAEAPEHEPHVDPAPVPTRMDPEKLAAEGTRLQRILRDGGHEVCITDCVTLAALVRKGHGGAPTDLQVTLLARVYQSSHPDVSFENAIRAVRKQFKLTN